MNRLSRPKTIYYYESKRLYKHQVTSECMVEVVNKDSPPGIRFRCRGPNHDCYGYAKQKEAKEYEIRETKGRISDERQWLEKLTKEPVED